MDKILVRKWTDKEDQMGPLLEAEGHQKRELSWEASRGAAKEAPRDPQVTPERRQVDPKSTQKEAKRSQNGTIFEPIF